MGKELVFNIGNIFNSKTPEGALYQHEAKYYYIAPYQRGYKWAANHPNDAVCVLMKDLFDASESLNSEYYLQFITTKVSKKNEDKILEVIDGQQRLTTLTILLSVLANKQDDNVLAISNNLLSYEVRPKVTEFFKSHIYNDIENILSKDWTSFIQEFPDNDEQDVYYLFNAAKKINELIDKNIKKPEKIREFENYVLNNVKIILNNIESNVNCEEMFSNLNGNKVDLTSSELIKGLILTNTARERNSVERRISYKEIIEIRAVMGRQWDELSNWANRDDIKSFFFYNSTNVLDELLFLLALKDNFSPIVGRSDKNEIFNYFQTEIKKGNKTSTKYFDELKKLKLILNEWFNDDKIYNTLGYLFFKKKGQKITIRDFIGKLELGKSEIRTTLKELSTQFFNDEITVLEYGLNKDQIHNLLLALSVFGDGSRFNFTAFNREIWSLEHIFPQNPDELPEELGIKDVEFIKSLGGEKLENYEIVKDSLKEFIEITDMEIVYNELKNKLNNETCKLKKDERRILYRLIKTDRLNSIGNMALLTKPDNSSNKNGMFDKKRYNVVERVSKGSFVPKHTYDVFSKLLSKQMTPELNVWTENDIQKHEDWIKTKIIEIKKTTQ